MEAIRACITAISLSGLEGCTVSELWRQLPANLELDDTLKSFLWSQLLQTAAHQTPPTILLFRTKEPHPPILEEGGRVVYPHKCSIVEKDGVRGSCAGWEEREDVTRRVVELRPSLEQLHDCYGDNLVLVGGQDQREHVLCPLNFDPTRLSLLSNKKYVSLELIGACQGCGVRRTFLNKFLNCDARTTFHITRALHQFGLITIQPCRMVVGRGLQNTYMLYLTRFASHAHNHLNHIEKRLNTSFLTAPYHTLSLVRIHEIFASKSIKPVRVVLRRWVQRGILERVDSMTTVCEDYANRHDMKCKGYRLVRPYTPDDSLVGEELAVEGEEELAEWGADEVDGERGVDNLEEEEQDVGVVKMEEEQDEAEVREGNQRTAVVREVPLGLQAYQLFEEKGPEGIEFQEFCRNGLELPYSLCRQAVNNLSKNNFIKSIIIDSQGSIRKTRLLAESHLKDSDFYRRLQSEQADTSTFKTISGGDESLCVLPDDPLPSTMATLLNNEVLKDGEDGKAEELKEEETLAGCLEGHGELKRRRVEWKMKHVMGGRSLVQSRRVNIVLQFIRDHQVISNLVDLHKHLIQQEHLDGREKVIDRKTLAKLVTSLVQQQLILREQMGTSSSSSGLLNNSLYYLPDSDQAKVTAERQQITREQEREAKKKMDKDRAVAEKEAQEAWLKKEEACLESDVDETPLEVIPGQKHKAKFIRLKHLHFYLWLIAYGYGPRDVPGESSTSGPSAQLLEEFTWMEVVEKAPTLSSGPGWISMVELVEGMPLILALFLMPIYIGAYRPLLPPGYVAYLNNPDKLKNKLYQVPQKLRKYISTVRLNEFLQNLKKMNLIKIVGNSRLNMKVCVLTESQVLDTSPCAARASFFLEESRELFHCTNFSLNSVKDLEEFWFHLQDVCVNTRIILPSLRHKSSGDNSRDSWCLTFDPHANQKKDESVNTRGFGAGGLPPLMFSHMNRNWSHGKDSTTRDSTIADSTTRDMGKTDMSPSSSRKRKKGWSSSMVDKRARRRGSSGGRGEAEGGVAEEEEEAEEMHYGPGDGLLAIPHHQQGCEEVLWEEDSLMAEDKEGCEDDGEEDVLHEGDKGEELGSDSVRGDRSIQDLGELGSPGLVSRSDDTEASYRHVVVPQSQVQAHMGGRCHARKRVQFDLPSSEVGTSDRGGSSKNKKTTPYMPPGWETALPYPSVVFTMEEGEDRYPPSRLHWTEEDDREVMVCYLAGVLLGQLVKDREPLSFQFIRDVHVRRRNQHHPCRASALKRRMFRLISPKSSSTLALLRDLQTELERLGSSGPQLEFESLCDFILDKLSQESLQVALDVLPDSLADLRTNYNVIEVSEKPTAVPQVATTDKPEQVLLLSDLLLSIGSKSSSERFKVFKLLRNFPEASLAEALSYLKAKGIVKSKIHRAPDLSVDPFAVSVFRSNFRFMFDSELSYEVFQEKRSFERAYESLQRDDQDVKFSLPEVVSAEGGELICSSQCSRGASQAILNIIASLDQKLVTCHSTVTCLEPSHHQIGRDQSSRTEVSLQNSEDELSELPLPEDLNETPLISENFGVIGEGNANVKSGVMEDLSKFKGSHENYPTEGDVNLSEKKSGEPEKGLSLQPEVVGGGGSIREGQVLQEDVNMEVVTDDLNSSKADDQLDLMEVDGVDGEGLPENHSQLKSAIELKKVIDQGFLNLQYSMNVASLLGPVPLVPCDQTNGTFPEGAQDQSCISGLQDYLACSLCPPPSERTLNSYLKLCQQYLSFTSCDCEYTSRVYQLIDQAGTTGLDLEQLRKKVKSWKFEGQRRVNTADDNAHQDTLEDKSPNMNQKDQGHCARLKSNNCGTGGKLGVLELSGCCLESDKSGGVTEFWGDLERVLNLEDIVTSLTNFEMVYRVGALKDVLVSHNHTHPWLCPTTGKDPVLVKFSPWMRLDSTDPNQKMLDKYVHAVYAFVISHPGVTWEKMVDQMAVILASCRLDDILKVLEYEGKVCRHTVASPGRSLFSDQESAEEVVYFEPVFT